VHQSFPRNLEARDFGFDSPQRPLVVSHGGRGLQAIVTLTSSDDMRRSGAKMLAGLPVNTLALVAPVIDPLATSTSFQGAVRELGPPFPRVLHPFAAVERATLGRTAAFQVR
jgi:hypothetical protein